MKKGKKGRTEKETAKRRGIRILPLTATLGAGVLLLAVLLAPSFVLALRQKSVMDTFYPVRVQGGSLTNPELAERVGMVHALDEAIFGYNTEELYGAAAEEACSSFYLQLEQLYGIGLMPISGLEAYRRYAYDEYAMVMREKTGQYVYDFEVMEVYCYPSERDYGNDEYMYLRAISHGGIIVQMEYHYYLYDMWEISEAEAGADGDTVPSMLQEEVIEGPDYSLQTGQVEAYLEYLGLEGLEDWRITGTEYGSQRAVSSYAQVSLYVDGLGYDDGIVIFGAGYY